ncbi:MAG: DUF134 domain-containing protein [Bacteroidota bacterium]
MSPRSKTLRKVLNPPQVKGFKPYGPEVKEPGKEPVYLLLEEFEALRLCDYLHLNHHDASLQMNVSRPTLTRIYAAALHKIATAFVEGRPLSIEGGKVYFDSDWYHCNSCRCHFNNPEKETDVRNCPLCGSTDFSVLNDLPQEEDSVPDACNGYCVCETCGYEIRHVRGVPCKEHFCPRCNSPMRRKTPSECP